MSCLCSRTGAVGNRFSMVLDHVNPAVEEKDRKDLIEFGVPQGVDFIAASFVQDCAAQLKHGMAVSGLPRTPRMSSSSETLLECEGVLSRLSPRLSILL